MADDLRMERLELRVEDLACRLERLESGASEPTTAAPPAVAGPTSTADPPRTQSAGEQSDWAPPAWSSPAPQPSPARPQPTRPLWPGPQKPWTLPAAGAARKAGSLQNLVGGRSIEDLLGGRILAWLGGLAVLIGVAFLFAVAVSRGWIGYGARTLVAGAGSTVLVGLGIWLHENRGRTEAALAAVATGVSALFVTLTVAAQVYELLPEVVALLMALGVGGIATALALRWESRGIAALGIVGGLLSPVLAGAPHDLGTMAILLIAAASAVGVLLRQRWDWLSFAVFAVTVPQWAAFLFGGPPIAAMLAVLMGFGAIGAAAAVGYELRVAAEKLRPSAAFLLALNAIVVAVGGWLAFHQRDLETVGRLWLAGVAAAHMAIGLASIRAQRGSHDFGLLALVIGVVVADVAFALAVEGPARAFGFAGASVLFAGLVRRRGGPGADGALAALGLGAHVTFALLQAMTQDAPLSLIEGGGLPAAGAAASLVAVASGCFVSARLAQGGHRQLRMTLDALGLALVAYLTALTLDGTQLVVAWAVEAAALAALARREGDGVAAWGSRAYLVLGLLQALMGVTMPEAVAAGTVDALSATVALLALAATAVVCARLTGEDEPEIRGLLDWTAIGSVAYLAAALVDGAALVVSWSALAVLLAELARRSRYQVWAWGAIANLVMAAAHALALEAPPTALVEGLPAVGPALAALGALVLSAAHAGLSIAGTPRWHRALMAGAALAALYLASVLVVTPFQPGDAGARWALLDLEVRQQGQVLLSTLWSLAGLAALVGGLQRDLRVVRLGALALLLATVAKVFLYDLATLTSIYRVISFVALGLLLLTGAFVWERMRPKPLPDLREAPEGIR